MAIYEAEWRRKPPVRALTEDQLTSRVFGALAILPKRTVVLPFLRLLGAETISRITEDDPVVSRMARWSYKDVESLNIKFWEYTDGSYPDVSVATPHTLIAIEVKKDLKPTRHQIVTQYKRARPKRKNFVYFLLTNNLDAPAEVPEAEGDLKRLYADARIHWIRWPQVWKWLCQISEDPVVEGVTKELLNDTIRLLEVERMKEPTGLRPEWFSRSVSRNLAKVQDLCSEISLTIANLGGELEARGLEQLQVNRNCGPDPKASTLTLKNPRDWILDYFEFHYRDKSWRNVVEAYTDPCLYIDFDLREGKEGVYVGLWWEKPRAEQIDDVGEHIRRNRGLVFNDTYWTDEGHLDVHYKIPFSDLADGKIVDVLMGKLIRMRDFAEGLETLSDDLGLKGTSKRGR